MKTRVRTCYRKSNRKIKLRILLFQITYGLISFLFLCYFIYILVPHLLLLMFILHIILYLAYIIYDKAYCSFPFQNIAHTHTSNAYLGDWNFRHYHKFYRNKKLENIIKNHTIKKFIKNYIVFNFFLSWIFAILSWTIVENWWNFLWAYLILMLGWFIFFLPLFFMFYLNTNERLKKCDIYFRCLHPSVLAKNMFTYFFY